MTEIPARKKAYLISPEFRNMLAFLSNPRQFQQSWMRTEGHLKSLAPDPPGIPGLSRIDIYHPSVFTDELPLEMTPRQELRQHLVRISQTAKALGNISDSIRDDVPLTLEQATQYLQIAKIDIDASLDAIHQLQARFGRGDHPQAGVELYDKWFHGVNSIEGAMVTYATGLSAALEAQISGGGPDSRIGGGDKRGPRKR